MSHLIFVQGFGWNYFKKDLNFEFCQKNSFIEVTSAMRLFIVILKHREVPDFLGLFSSLFLLNVLFRMLLWPLEAHLKL